MPEQANPSEASSTFETITWQLAMAFGHGAGNLLATPGAVTAAIAPFRETFSDNVEHWDEWSLKSIVFARTLGQVAATLAVMDGAVVIRGAHVTSALGLLGDNEIMPLGGCGCFGS
jgi:hypothetical protein